jgi:hypothetical protein
MKKIIVSIAFIVISGICFSQQPADKGIIKEGKPGYFQNTIMKDVRAVDEQQEPVKNSQQK